jgi:ribosomal protein S6--L-glutamate ligase
MASGWCSFRDVHIAILSQKPETYSTRRLVEAGEVRGHRMSIINYMQCTMVIASHRPKIAYMGEPLTDVDAIIPRVAAPHTLYGTAVVRQFEMMGVYSVNGSQAIARSRDKLRSLQILSRKGIGLPVTGFANAAKDVQGLIQEVGGPPLIIKLLEGTQGIGVVLAETQNAAESVIDAFRNLNANILVQEFIAEANGADLRCFVVGTRVVAAMQRQAAPGEFRSNIHRGGTGTKVKLTPEERTIAVSAAKAMGLHVAGVDIIRSNHGALVIEVNSSPGIEGIEQATEKDVAGRIIEYVETHAGAKKAQDAEKILSEDH